MSDSDHLYSRVNLTPLLDIIFLLLFVVVGGMVDRDERRAAAGAELAASNAAMTIERDALLRQIERLISERDALATALTGEKDSREKATGERDALALRLAALTRTLAELKRTVADERTAHRSALLAQAKTLRETEKKLAALGAQYREATKMMANPHRTMAAAQVLQRQFKVYELTVERERWMRFVTPDGGKKRRRVSAITLEKWLEDAHPRGSIVLLFIDPKAIFKDVEDVRRVLKKLGFAFNAYRMPPGKK